MGTPRRTSPALGAVTAAALAVTVAGCGIGSEDTGPVSVPGQGAVTVEHGDLVQVLAAADPARQQSFTVALGDGASSWLRADVDVEGQGDPRFRLQLGEGTVDDITDLLVVDSIVYLGLPGLGYTSVDPSTLGIDLSEMVGVVNLSSTVADLAQAAHEITYQGTEDLSGDQVGRYLLSVDLAEAADSVDGLAELWAQAGSGDMSGEITGEIWVDSEGLPRRVSMGGDSVVLDLSNWGAVPTIAAPDASEVQDWSQVGDILSRLTG